MTKLRVHVTPFLFDTEAPSEVRPIDLPYIDVQTMDDDALATVLRSGLAEMFHSSDLVEKFVDHGFCIVFPHTTPMFPIPLYSVQDYGQRPLYGVTEAGRLVIDDLDLDHYTVGDLRRGSEAGYLPEPWDEIVVTQPHGLGGGLDLTTELISFLNGVGVDLVVGGVVLLWRKAAGRVSRSRKQNNLKSLAAEWAANGITEPYDLRAWIDSFPRWSAAEVGHRLGLTKKQATQLLTALGYEYHPELHLWTLGTSVRARSQRKNWEKREIRST